MNYSHRKALERNRPEIVTDTFAGSLSTVIAQDSRPFAPTGEKGRQVGIGRGYVNEGMFYCVNEGIGTLFLSPNEHGYATLLLLSSYAILLRDVDLARQRKSAFFALALCNVVPPFIIT